MPLPTPEQFAAMAREYAAVTPMPLPPRPDEDWGALCELIAQLNALVLPLGRVQHQAAAVLAQQALDAIHQMQEQVAALDNHTHDFACQAPSARNISDLLRQALLANARLCRELYVERDGKSLAQQLPYLASLSHYTYSLLLSLAAF